MQSGTFGGNCKLYSYVAIDRTSKFAFVQLVEKAVSPLTLVAAIAAVHYWIHTVLTDNGIQFRFPPCHAHGTIAR